MLEIFISYICPNFNSHAISKHYRRDKLTVNTTSTNHDNNGAGWDKVEGSGPKLPTKHDTTMFFFVAWSAPNAILSSIYGRGFSPNRNACLIHQHHQLWHWHHQWLPTCLSQSMCSSRLVSASILCVWQGERVVIHQKQCHEQSRRWPGC